MKKLDKSIIKFLTLVVIVFSTQAKATDGKNCAEKYADFYSSNSSLSKSQKEDILVCEAFCDKTSNLEYARNFCGIDECKLEYASTGELSSWCCKMANMWEHKQGAETNPLQSIKKECKTNKEVRTDIVSFWKEYVNNGYASDQACTNVQKITAFDYDVGKKIYNYCSQKRSAMACKAQITKGQKSPACCALAEANNGRLAGTEFFKDDYKFAKYIEYSLNSCKSTAQVTEKTLSSDNTNKGSGESKTAKKYQDSDFNFCISTYNTYKNLSRSCCVAFYNGVLIPNQHGINFTQLDKYCFPEHYAK